MSVCTIISICRVCSSCSPILPRGTCDVEMHRLDMPSPFAAGLLFAFTAAFMYQFDGVEADSQGGAGPLDQTLVDQLIGHEGRPLPLDPRRCNRSIVGCAASVSHRAARRRRPSGCGIWATWRRAKWMRRCGILSMNWRVKGPLPNFTYHIRPIPNAGFSRRRWSFIAARSPPPPLMPRRPGPPRLRSCGVFLKRRSRRPGGRAGALSVRTNLGARSTRSMDAPGRPVSVTTSPSEPLQWSAPDNFEQMQRGTLSILRREVLTCPPAQFADFVTRWQHVHPATQADLAEVMPRLQACALPLELWDQAILPMRVRNYSRRQLDEWIGTGQWTWHCRRDGDSETLAFVERSALPQLAPPVLAGMQLDRTAAAIVEILGGRGALFTAEIAAGAGLAEGTTRSSLWSLLRASLVTNDQFDVVRRGEPPHMDQAPPLHSRGEVRAFLRDARRRQTNAWPEGRWSLLAWGQPDPESAAFFQARLLLERYGIVARELALLSGCPTPWRILYEILSRLELAGDVRRGYFVEGLSGLNSPCRTPPKCSAKLLCPASRSRPSS